MDAWLACLAPFVALLAFLVSTGAERYTEDAWVLQPNEEVPARVGSARSFLEKETQIKGKGHCPSGTIACVRIMPLDALFANESWYLNMSWYKKLEEDKYKIEEKRKVNMELSKQRHGTLNPKVNPRIPALTLSVLNENQRSVVCFAEEDLNDCESAFSVAREADWYKEHPSQWGEYNDGDYRKSGLLSWRYWPTPVSNFWQTLPTVATSDGMQEHQVWYNLVSLKTLGYGRGFSMRPNYHRPQTTIDWESFNRDSKENQEFIVEIPTKEAAKRACEALTPEHCSERNEVQDLLTFGYFPEHIAKQTCVALGDLCGGIWCKADQCQPFGKLNVKYLISVPHKRTPGKHYVWYKSRPDRSDFLHLAYESGTYFKKESGLWVEKRGCSWVDGKCSGETPSSAIPCQSRVNCNSTETTINQVRMYRKCSEHVQHALCRQLCVENVEINEDPYGHFYTGDKIGTLCNEHDEVFLKTP